MAAPATKSERTRARILDAAAKVFREQGYANARLSDIAELAGMRTGSLYYHFDGREALVAEILRLGIERAWDHVRTAVDALPPDATPIDRLATAIRAHTIAVLSISDYSSAQARIVGQIPPEVHRAHVADQRRYGAYWHELLEAAAASGALRPGLDLFAVRMMVLGALNRTVEWYSPTRHASPDAIADLAASMALTGITGPGPAASPQTAAPLAPSAVSRRRRGP